MNTFRVVNPANGTTLARIPFESSATVATKYAIARAAQPGWARVPLSARLGMIRRFRAALVQEKAVELQVFRPESREQKRVGRNIIAARAGHCLKNAEEGAVRHDLFGQ